MFIRVVSTGSYSTGGTAQEIYDFETSEDITDIIIDQFLLDLSVWFVNFLWGVLLNEISENFTWQNLEVYQSVDVTNGTFVSLGSIALSEAGGGAGDMMTEQTAAYVYASRQGGGRGASKFVPGIPESENTDGSLDSGMIAGMVDYATEWLSGWVGTTTGIFVMPICYSKVEGLTFPLTGSAAVSTIYSNQNRRRRDIGM